MSASSTEPNVESLWRRAENAIRAARPREQIVRLLEDLAAAAAEGTEAARFAHRHLAEFLLEENPWGAALHLRRVLQSAPDDDVAQALMGLAQALQGNFRMAVGAYRRAVSLAPGNPWYNHNLGHLLDVALGQSREALAYLRRAHRAQPEQEEVAASLAHCMGRLGQRDEALALARSLAAKHPRHKEIRALVGWLERGAEPGLETTTPGLLSPLSPAASAARAGGARPPGEEAPRGSLSGLHPEVERALEQAMALGNYPRAQIDRARALWRDYAAEARPVVTAGRAASLAEAVEYALARIDGASMRQRDIAARQGVSVSALAARYASLRARLKLVPGDTRYAARLES